MTMLIGTRGYYLRVGILLSDDRADLDCACDVDFSGQAKAYFDSIENSGFGALGASYTVTAHSGHASIVAPVPLPPAGLMMLGPLGALFAAASRRGSGSAAGPGPVRT